MSSQVSFSSPSALVQQHMNTQNQNVKAEVNIAVMKKTQDVAGQSVLKLLDASDLGKNINTIA